MKKIKLQAKRVVLAYWFAIVSLIQYVLANVFMAFKADEAAEQMMLKAFRSGIKSMDALEKWNWDRRVLDLETGFKVGLYKSELETLIELIENEKI